jgi:hypothetical protein
MKRIITNPLAVITLICAMAATAAAQTPAAQTPMPPSIETTIGPSGETKIRTPDGGAVVVFPGKGGFNRIYRTSVVCTTTRDGWGKTCYNSSHTCDSLDSDMSKCCGTAAGAVSSASCNATVD